VGVVVVDGGWLASNVQPFAPQTKHTR